MSEKTCRNIIFLQLGNHDRSRVASNVGLKYVDVMTLLLLLLPGTPTVYQGDEIAMTNVDVPWEQAQDPKALYFGKVNSELADNSTLKIISQFTP